jgi:hypothetical protein
VGNDEPDAAGEQEQMSRTHRRNAARALAKTHGVPYQTAYQQILAQDEHRPGPLDALVGRGTTVAILDKPTSDQPWLDGPSTWTGAKDLDTWDTDHLTRFAAWYRSFVDREHSAFTKRDMRELDAALTRRGLTPTDTTEFTINGDPRLANLDLTAPEWQGDQFGGLIGPAGQRRAALKAAGFNVDSFDADSDLQYGVPVIYCGQHLRSHTVGWCTVALYDKRPLAAQNVEESGDEVRALGLPIYNDTEQPVRGLHNPPFTGRTATCSYCDAPVSEDVNGVWVDETDGDGCDNPSGTHGVWDPTAGIDPGACAEYVNDPGIDVEDGQDPFCARCFHPVTEHAVVTQIPLRYRDGSNYKEYDVITLRGALTAELRTQIEAALDEDMYLIPGQVGLPHLGERMASFPGDDDHVWHELVMDSVEIVAERYAGRPITVTDQIDGTVQGFADALTQANKHGWDIVRWSDLYSVG